MRVPIEILKSAAASKVRSRPGQEHARWPSRGKSVVRGFLKKALAAALTAQLVLAQGAPAREYFYFGSRLVAIEVRGNAGPTDLSYVALSPQLQRQVSMKFAMTDPDGGANVAQMNVIVGRWFNNLRTCYFHWVKAANTVYLNNGQYGANEAWLPMALDASGPASVESENCKLNKSGTTAVVNGFNLELTVNVELRAPLGGQLYVWTWGRDASLAEIGWEYLGDYIPQNIGGSGPTISMLNGAPDSNRNVTFQFHVPDPDGARNMYQLNVLVNSVFDGVASCYFVVQTLTNGIALFNGLAPPSEAWDQWISLDTATPASIESNYCKITTAGSAHAPLGSDPNKLVVTVNVQFKGAMSGSGKNVWVWTRDMADAAFGWEHKETWTIP